jgi:hypothetical protein
MISNPSIFDELNVQSNQLLSTTLDFVIKEYNFCIQNQEDVKSHFDKISAIAKVKGAKYDSVFSKIGVQLMEGKPPAIVQIHYASHYLMASKKV